MCRRSKGLHRASRGNQGWRRPTPDNCPLKQPVWACRVLSRVRQGAGRWKPALPACCPVSPGQPSLSSLDSPLLSISFTSCTYFSLPFLNLGLPRNVWPGWLCLISSLGFGDCAWEKLRHFWNQTWLLVTDCGNLEKWCNITGAEASHLGNKAGLGFPGGSVIKKSTCQCRRHRFSHWIWKIPGRRAWQPTPGFLPGESYGQRSLAGCSPWGHKELDMT